MGKAIKAQRGRRPLVDLTTTRRTFLGGMALAGLGVPEGSVRITDTALEGVPDQIPAG
jgi:hypothetical protein